MTWWKLLLLWVIAFILVFCGLLVSFYYKEWLVQMKLIKAGVKQTLQREFAGRFFFRLNINNDNNGNNINDNSILTNNNSIGQDNNGAALLSATSPGSVEDRSICFQFLRNLFRLLTDAWPLTGSLVIYDALIYSISAIYMRDFSYDENIKLWLLWVAIVCTLLISTLFVIYLSRMVSAIRQQRRNFVKLVKEALRSNNRSNSDSDSSDDNLNENMNSNLNLGSNKNKNKIINDNDDDEDEKKMIKLSENLDGIEEYNATSIFDEKIFASNEYIQFREDSKSQQ